MVTQRSYQAAVAAVRSRLLRAAGTLWAGMGSYRDTDIDRMVRIIAPLVQAGQVQVANLTEAYFRQEGARAGVEFAFVTGGRGVPVAEVYRRPAIATYTALSEGKSVSAAVAAGGQRLASIVAMDLQMAKVRQADRSLSSARVRAFQRTLTGAENCGLCVIASTQRYWVGDLLPIHPGCDCGVDVLPPGVDPAEQVFNQGLLDATHAEVESKLGATDYGARGLGLGKVDARDRPISDYTDLIMTRTHGEYGPTLTWRTDDFTSAADIAALA